uniref:Gag-pol polyprotein n=1 Tax=Solanum tuberosum TaxID=4113 RepID=M1D144_SOLTU
MVVVGRGEARTIDGMLNWEKLVVCMTNTLTVRRGQPLVPAPLSSLRGRRDLIYLLGNSSGVITDVVGNLLKLSFQRRRVCAIPSSDEVRVFGERTQAEGEEEKKDSPRTIDFGGGFVKELILQGILVDPLSSSGSIPAARYRTNLFRNRLVDSLGSSGPIPLAGYRMRWQREIIMHLRRAIRGRPARRNVEEQELPNAPEVQPQGEVTNTEFCEAIKMLSQVVTNEAGQQRGAR